jgi:heme exporter protein A
VSQLCLERYFQPVFRPVDFSLGAGELLVVTGDNGSGKTTLIRLLGGIITPSSGEIRLQAGSTAYLGHALAIKDDLSAEENLRFTWQFSRPGKMPAASLQLEINAALLSAGLSRVAHQPARTLSAGQRKRCALARLLVADAPLWLLDEPYSNLDGDGIAMVDGLLKRHLESGGAAVVATHGEHRPGASQLRELRLAPGYEH